MCGSGKMVALIFTQKRKKCFGYVKPSHCAMKNVLVVCFLAQAKKGHPLRSV